jgi:hypothetical protein
MISLENDPSVDIPPSRLVAGLESVTDVRQVRNEFESIETHIMFRGQWHHLCRTDWADDVCTWCPEEDEKLGGRGKLEAVLARARRGDYYGARLGELRPGGIPRFAVIDASSDG